MAVAGVLLAGGASTRFGSEKAVAALGPGLLMEAPLQALAAVCDTLAISARQGSGAEAIAEVCGYPALNDLEAGAKGPLCGVLAALRWARDAGADYLATAPCDAARLDADRLEALLALAARSGSAAVAASNRGLEPLIAIWPVRDGLRRLEAMMAEGAHPSVRAVLTTLDYVSLDGFEAANINDREALAALSSPDECDEPDHARLFAFENDFVLNLRCIPMCVRYKLDRIAIKLTLRQWSRFTLADRREIRFTPCETEADAAALRDRVTSLVARRSGDVAKRLEIQPEPHWLSPSPPQSVTRLASERGVSPPAERAWAELPELARYALVKLTRDRHENRNFVPAMTEFGLCN